MHTAVSDCRVSAEVLAVLAKLKLRGALLPQQQTCCFALGTQGDCLSHACQLQTGIPELVSAAAGEVVLTRRADEELLHILQCSWQVP